MEYNNNNRVLVVGHWEDYRLPKDPRVVDIPGNIDIYKGCLLQFRTCPALFVVDSIMDNNEAILTELHQKYPEHAFCLGKIRYVRVIYKNEESPSNNNNNINYSKTTSMKNNKMLNTYFERIKAQFMPEVDTCLQVTMDGQVAVPASNGDFVAINGEELTSYPAEMTLDMPVYVLAKKVEDVKAGDIIKSGNSYSKVTKINKNNSGKLVSFSTLSYSGHGKTVKPITDFLMGQSTVKVVINLMQGFGNVNGINPMMLMALKDGDSDNSLFTLMAIQQMTQGQAANVAGGFNPMMLMLMGDGENNDTFKTLMMMQMFGGNMNLFGVPATPAAE